MRSSLFFSQPTVIDHAYIDNFGMIIGGSFNPHFVVTGEVDDVENVVVDFSTLKKQLKAYIDDQHSGFDHKLWVIQGWSKLDIFERKVTDWTDDDRYSIVTPYVDLDVPANAVRVLTRATDYSPDEIGADLCRYLKIRLNQGYPGVDLDVEVHMARTPQLFDQVDSGLKTCNAQFSYVHGLKDSTSWGCQNNSHGHLSFIQLFYDKHAPDAPVYGLCADIASYLDRTVFINEANVTHAGDIGVAISYTTIDRGMFKALYSKDVKLVVLPSETTIEFLVEHVLSLFKEQLQEAGVKRLYLSEGLSKGALANL